MNVIRPAVVPGTSDIVFESAYPRLLIPWMRFLIAVTLGVSRPRCRNACPAVCRSRVKRTHATLLFEHQDEFRFAFGEIFDEVRTRDALPASAKCNPSLQGNPLGDFNVNAPR
jgi:hypothetical protein